ncbi:MAG: RNA polymerase sigma-54 factor, partial [Thermogutta sp.]|nr:RNA polymerase sigma-54 factor [Thermogutta sp.]
MRMSLGHHLRQVQKQVQKQILSPRMIQSMEILQLPLHDLEQRVAQELAENPALEIEESQEQELEEEPRLEEEEERTDTVRSDLEREFVVNEENSAEEFSRLVEMEREIPEYFEEEMSRPSRDRIEEYSERYHDMMANLPDHNPTL